MTYKKESVYISFYFIYWIQYVQISALRSSAYGPDVPLIRSDTVALVVSVVVNIGERYALYDGELPDHVAPISKSILVPDVSPILK